MSKHSRFFTFVFLVFFVFTVLLFCSICHFFDQIHPQSAISSKDFTLNFRLFTYIYNKEEKIQAMRFYVQPRSMSEAN